MRRGEVEFLCPLIECFNGGQFVVFDLGSTILHADEVDHVCVFEFPTLPTAQLTESFFAGGSPVSSLFEEDDLSTKIEQRNFVTKRVL